MTNRDDVSSVRHRAGALLLGLSLALGTVAACGDDNDPPSEDDDGTPDDGDDGDDDGAACVSTEAEEFPEGILARPEDLTVKGFDCPEDGLAEVDLNGRWSLAGDDLFNFEMPYIRESCEEGIEIDSEAAEAADDTLIHRDDTNLFVRTRIVVPEVFTITRAARVCAAEGSDELTVVFGFCYEGPEVTEPDCEFSTGVMKRFGRPPGEGDAEGLELVSEWNGGDEPWPASTTTNVKVAGGVAFVSRLTYRDDDVGDMRLVDVSNPEEPRDLGAFVGGEGGNDFNDVKVFQAGEGTFAILAGDTCPIVDASDPTAAVGTVPEFAHSIFVREDAMGRPLAYLATTGQTPDVPIYDLSDPANPVLVERVPLPETANPDDPPDQVARVHDLYAEEDRLYLNAQTEGFTIMDRDGADWTVGGELPPTGYSHASWAGEVAGRRVAITGDEGLGAHMQVVDIDPASKEFMTEIGAYQTRPEVSIHNIMLLGERAYIAYYHDGVRVVDLADPTDPQLVAYYHTWDVETGGSGGFESAIGIDVDVEAGLIYVADTARGLLILRETK